MANDDGKVVSIDSKRPITLKKRRGPGRPTKGGHDPRELIDGVTDGGIDRYLTSKDRDEDARRQYSPEDFHVAISDENGHDAKKQVRFHPMLINELAMVVARGMFPVESVDDLIRVGAFELLKKLYKLERGGGTPNPIPRLAAINRLSEQVFWTRMFEHTIKRVKEETQALIDDGRGVQAAKFLYDVMREVRDIPQAAWREQCIAELRREFPDLIQKHSRSVKVRVGKKRNSRSDDDAE